MPLYMPPPWSCTQTSPYLLDVVTATTTTLDRVMRVPLPGGVMRIWRTVAMPPPEPPVPAMPPEPPDPPDPAMPAEPPVPPVPPSTAAFWVLRHPRGARDRAMVNKRV